MMKFLYAASLLLAGVTATPTPIIESNGDGNDTVLAARATSFWYANVDHTGAARGYAPDLDGDYAYPVYMAVSPGDGAGIQRAITAGTNGGTRHPKWLASQPRVCSPSRTLRKRKNETDNADRSSTSHRALILSARLSGST